MGKYLVDFLAENKNNLIYVTSRKEQFSTRDNVKFIKGDAHDLDFLRSLFDSDYMWDAVVDFMIYNTTEFQERKDLLLSGTYQYFLISSSRVYADTEIPLKEDSNRLLDVINNKDFLSSDKYALSKAREEDILKKDGRKNWTIVRPYITYSNVRFQLGVFEKEDWLYRALNGRAIVFSNDIASMLTTVTFGKDVSRGIASLVGEKNALGRAFHITCTEPLTWKDILNIYLDVLKDHGIKAKVIYADHALDITSQEEKIKYDRMYDRVFDNEAISEFCDCSVFLNPKDGLPLCLNQFLKAPNFKDINWTTQARMDRISGDKTPLKEINGIKDRIKYIILRYIFSYEICSKILKRFH